MARTSYKLVQPGTSCYMCRYLDRRTILGITVWDYSPPPYKVRILPPLPKLMLMFLSTQLIRIYLQIPCSSKISSTDRWNASKQQNHANYSVCMQAFWYTLHVYFSVLSQTVQKKQKLKLLMSARFLPRYITLMLWKRFLQFNFKTTFSSFIRRKNIYIKRCRFFVLNCVIFHNRVPTRPDLPLQ
jgi:hypothetical protein